MEGQGPPPMFPRGFEGPPVDGPPPDSFFGRPPFDDMDRRAREEGRHPRGWELWGPRRGPPGGRDEGRFRGGERDGPSPWRRDEDMGPRRGSRPEEAVGKQGEEEEKQGPSVSSIKGERDRARKSRWSNASPTAESAPEPVCVVGEAEEAQEMSVDENNMIPCAEEPQQEQGTGDGSIGGGGGGGSGGGGDSGGGDGGGDVTGSEGCYPPSDMEPQSDSTPCIDEQPPSTAEPCSEGDAPGGEDAV